jgi:transcription elongation factor Elf1
VEMNLEFKCDNCGHNKFSIFSSWNELSSVKNIEVLPDDFAFLWTVTQQTQRYHARCSKCNALVGISDRAGTLTELEESMIEQGVLK